MRLSEIITAVAALAVASTPAVATPSNPAAKLSLANQDSQAGVVDQRTEPAKRNSGLFIAGGALLVVILLAVALGSGDGDSTPASS